MPKQSDALFTNAQRDKIEAAQSQVFDALRAYKGKDIRYINI